MVAITERKLNDEAIERWSDFLEQSRADANWQEESNRERQFRAAVFPEIRNLLGQYLARSLDLKTFQSTIDRKSRVDWDVLGIKGTSGAMFLNMLVKNVPEQDAIDSWLRAALPVPADARGGEEQMRRFYSSLAGLIQSRQVKGRLIQAARTPFLLSAFWHLQEPENWPVYYLSARGVLGRERLFREDPKAGPVRNYMAFRQVWLELSRLLDVDALGLEHLCLWVERQGPHEAPLDPSPRVIPSVIPTDPKPPQTEFEGSLHTKTQWLLARIGKHLGYKVWIARNDRSKVWGDQILGDFSIPELPPLGAGEATQRTIELIDVLWISGFNQIAAAFEVEHSTAIYSGLLRMSDLAVLAPVVSFPVYIVAPRSRLQEVRKQLERPTFQALELHNRAAYFSIEDLVKDAENIMRFGANVAAIDALAARVDDIGDDEGWR